MKYRFGYSNKKNSVVDFFVSLRIIASSCFTNYLYIFCFLVFINFFIESQVYPAMIFFGVLYFVISIIMLVCYIVKGKYIKIKDDCIIIYNWAVSFIRHIIIKPAKKIYYDEIQSVEIYIYGEDKTKKDRIGDHILNSICTGEEFVILKCKNRNDYQTSYAFCLKDNESFKNFIDSKINNVR